MLGRVSLDMSVGGGGTWSCEAAGCITSGMGVLAVDEDVSWGVAIWCASVLLNLDAELVVEALV